MTMRGTRTFGPAGAVILAAALAPAAATAGMATSTVTSQAAVKWMAAGIPGVSTAPVDGDMDKGASHFYLRYVAGFVAPLHHHSPDHYVTTVTGTLVLIVDGAEHRLPPGSYFELLGKKPHATRCEGDEACVMFIDARGRWDVVPDDSPTGTR